MSDELNRLRDRVHKLADDQQEHRMKIAEHELRLNQMSADVIDLRDAAITSVHLDALERTLTLKLDHLTQTVTPIKRALNWAVALILSGVLLALLNLVVKSPQP